MTVSLLSCGTNKEIAGIEPHPGAADSVSCDLLVTEPGFETWMATNREPVWYHEYSYYRHFNHLYVNEWNNRVRATENDIPHDFRIDYDYRVDNGIDLEFELYGYFKFMQQKYDIRLLVTDWS